jgi:hypothetical protein
MDPEGLLGREIGGLHESVLETDPTGREMRPKQLEQTLGKTATA